MGHARIPSPPLGPSGERDDNGRATEDDRAGGIDAAKTGVKAQVQILDLQHLASAP